MRKVASGLKLWVLLLTAALAVGCAGTAFDWSRVRQIQAGMTPNQVTSIVGQPYLVQSRPDGSMLYVWSHANGMTGSSRSFSVPFVNGRVSAPPNIPDSFR